MTVGGQKWPIVTALSRHIFGPLKIRPNLALKLTTEIFSMDIVCGDIIFMQIFAGFCGCSLERARQATLGLFL